MRGNTSNRTEPKGITEFLQEPKLTESILPQIYIIPTQLPFYFCHFVLILRTNETNIYGGFNTGTEVLLQVKLIKTKEVYKEKMIVTVTCPIKNPKV